MNMVCDEDSHSPQKGTLSVSQELDAFSSEILTPPPKNKTEGINAQKLS